MTVLLVLLFQHKRFPQCEGPRGQLHECQPCTAGSGLHEWGCWYVRVSCTAVRQTNSYLRQIPLPTQHGSKIFFWSIMSSFEQGLLNLGQIVPVQLKCTLSGANLSESLHGSLGWPAPLLPASSNGGSPSSLHSAP